MGLLSLSNLAIYIKKEEFSGFKALKMISKVRGHPKFNLGQLNRAVERSENPGVPVVIRWA